MAVQGVPNTFSDQDLATILREYHPAEADAERDPLVYVLTQQMVTQRAELRQLQAHLAARTWEVKRWRQRAETAERRPAWARARLGIGAAP